MAEYSVVVTDHDFEDLSVERSVLEGIATVRDCTGTIGETSADDETLRNADAVLNLRAPLGASRVEKLENCQVIARYGIGVDNVDVDVASEAGIPITNVPDYCLEEVATHATTLGLNLLRGVKQYDTSVGMGDWSRDAVKEICRVSELTVGVVGYGAIGREVSKRAAAFGPSIIASDPYLEPTDLEGDPADLVSFEELLSRSHLVTVHSPLTEETEGLFNESAFDQMRDEAVLVNVARGPIVDDAALLDAIDSGEISGAGLDVFPEEPPETDHPLRDHPRVVTTPHVAWYSREANEERRRKAAELVHDALSGALSENIVNEAEL